MAQHRAMHADEYWQAQEHAITRRLSSRWADSYLGYPVPAGLPSPGDGVVHDVISHQEEGLQLQMSKIPRQTDLTGNRLVPRC